MGSAGGGGEEIHARFRGAVKKVLTGEDEGRTIKIRDVKNQTAVVVTRFIYLSAINCSTHLSFKINERQMISTKSFHFNP